METNTRLVVSVYLKGCRNASIVERTRKLLDARKVSRSYSAAPLFRQITRYFCWISSENFRNTRNVFNSKRTEKSAIRWIFRFLQWDCSAAVRGRSPSCVMGLLSSNYLTSASSFTSFLQSFAAAPCLSSYHNLRRKFMTVRRETEINGRLRPHETRS